MGNIELQSNRVVSAAAEFSVHHDFSKFQKKIQSLSLIELADSIESAARSASAFDQLDHLSQVTDALKKSRVRVSDQLGKKVKEIFEIISDQYEKISREPVLADLNSGVDDFVTAGSIRSGISSQAKSESKEVKKFYQGLQESTAQDDSKGIEVLQQFTEQSNSIELDQEFRSLVQELEEFKGEMHPAVGDLEQIYKKRAEGKTFESIRTEFPELWKRLDLPFYQKLDPLILQRLLFGLKNSKSYFKEIQQLVVELSRFKQKETAMEALVVVYKEGIDKTRQIKSEIWKQLDLEVYGRMKEKELTQFFPERNLEEIQCLIKEIGEKKTKAAKKALHQVFQLLEDGISLEGIKLDRLDLWQELDVARLGELREKGEEVVKGLQGVNVDRLNLLIEQIIMAKAEENSTDFIFKPIEAFNEVYFLQKSGKLLSEICQKNPDLWGRLDLALYQNIEISQLKQQFIVVNLYEELGKIAKKFLEKKGAFLTTDEYVQALTVLFAGAANKQEELEIVKNFLKQWRLLRFQLKAKEDLYSHSPVWKINALLETAFRELILGSDQRKQAWIEAFFGDQEIPHSLISRIINCKKKSDIADAILNGKTEDLADPRKFQKILRGLDVQEVAEQMRTLDFDALTPGQQANVLLFSEIVEEGITEEEEATLRVVDAIKDRLFDSLKKENESEVAELSRKGIMNRWKVEKTPGMWMRFLALIFDFFSKKVAEAERSRMQQNKKINDLNQLFAEKKGKPGMLKKAKEIFFNQINMEEVEKVFNQIYDDDFFNDMNKEELVGKVKKAPILKAENIIEFQSGIDELAREIFKKDGKIGFDEHTALIRLVLCYQIKEDKENLWACLKRMRELKVGSHEPGSKEDREASHLISEMCGLMKEEDRTNRDTIEWGMWIAGSPSKAPEIFQKELAEKSRVTPVDDLV